MGDFILWSSVYWTYLNYISHTPLRYFYFPPSFAPSYRSPKQEGRTYQCWIEVEKKSDHNHAGTSCEAIRNVRCSFFTLCWRTRKGENVVLWISMWYFPMRPVSACSLALVTWRSRPSFDRTLVTMLDKQSADEDVFPPSKDNQILGV